VNKFASHDLARLESVTLSLPRHLSQAAHVCAQEHARDGDAPPSAVPSSFEEVVIEALPRYLADSPAAVAFLLRFPHCEVHFKDRTP
jgi:hypothetical protein